jgi:hypothetical protein
MSEILQLRPRSRTIEAALNYLGPLTERPRNYTFDPPRGEPRTNIVPEPHLVPIRDARAAAAAFRLDDHGFAVIKAPAAFDDFADEAAIRQLYYPDSARILQQAAGAGRVFIFDHTLRRRVAGADDRSPGTPRQPVARVHVDYTVRSGPQRVRDLLGDEAECLLAGRVQIVNLWRPIRGPLRDAPLAVADAASVAFEDLVPSDLVYPDRVGETYSVRYNPAHRWYYVPDMMPDEALLLKSFDSATDGRARFAPHSAFVDPTAEPPILPRESIEIRALLFG